MKIYVWGMFFRFLLYCFVLYLIDYILFGLIFSGFLVMFYRV